MNYLSQVDAARSCCPLLKIILYEESGKDQYFIIGILKSLLRHFPLE